MIDYAHRLRVAVLEMKHESLQEKADALNMLEQIIEGADVDALVEQIGNGTVPVTYVVKEPK